MCCRRWRDLNSKSTMMLYRRRHETFRCFPLLGTNHFYRPQRSCGQGYVFTSVCDSVNTPRRRLLLRTVRILLECILVITLLLMLTSEINFILKMTHLAKFILSVIVDSMHPLVAHLRLSKGFCKKDQDCKTSLKNWH